jgi:hypothetical protein
MITLTTAAGFQGQSEAKPELTFVFFHVYIVLTSWVIMSLFIGVISMGMFDAFERMKVSGFWWLIYFRVLKQARQEPGQVGHDEPTWA